VEKSNRIVIVVCITVIAIILSGFIFWNIGQYAGYNRGVREIGAREADYLERIEGYRKRETERNKREGERIELTQNRLDGLAEYSNSTTDQLKKLREIHGILENFYNSSIRDYVGRNNHNSGNSE